MVGVIETPNPDPDSSTRYNGSYARPSNLPPHLCWTPPGACLADSDDIDNNAADGQEWIVPPANTTGYEQAMAQAMSLDPDAAWAFHQCGLTGAVTFEEDTSGCARKRRVTRYGTKSGDTNFRCALNHDC
jgi:hypothetical protein